MARARGGPRRPSLRRPRVGGGRPTGRGRGADRRRARRAPATRRRGTVLDARARLSRAGRAGRPERGRPRPHLQSRAELTRSARLELRQDQARRRSRGQSVLAGGAVPAARADRRPRDPRIAGARLFPAAADRAHDETVHDAQVSDDAGGRRSQAAPGVREPVHQVERQGRRARHDAVQADRGSSGDADRPSSPKDQPRRAAAIVERTSRRDVADRATPPRFRTSSSSTSSGTGGDSSKPSRESPDSGRSRAGAVPPSTRWYASTSATPGGVPSGPTSRFSLPRRRPSSRARVRVETGVGMSQYLCIAPDVKLWRDVKLASFINLYGCEIADETKIGAFVEIMKNSRDGTQCKHSTHTFICEGVTIEDHVFIGHGVTFINDAYPRATTPTGELQTTDDWTVQRTLVHRGASIGSGATILANVVIGQNAIVGAGSVVTHAVPDHAIVAGNPARVLRFLVPNSGNGLLATPSVGTLE